MKNKPRVRAIMKRVTAFFLLIFTFIFLFNPLVARGADCSNPSKILSSSYDINYLVDAEGTAIVSQKVTLKNLVAECYASSYALNINSTKVRDVLGEDSLGKLQVNLEKSQVGTVISAQLNDAVVGKGKSVSFTLKYTIDGLANRVGNFWELVAPRIITTELVENYNLRISVPMSFGEPFSLSLKPIEIKNDANTLVLIFGKEALDQRSVFASFGSEQQIYFNFKVPLENKNFFNQKYFIPIPPDTNTQQILIKSFDPKPEKILIDENGNYITEYKLGANKFIEAKIEGYIRIINSKEPLPSPKEFKKSNLDSYKQSTNFIETADKLVKEKALNLKSSQEVYNFVVGYLDYNFDSYKKSKADRIGAKNLLKNKKAATNQDFVDLFVALNRAIGVPSREVFGIVLTNEDSKPAFVGSPLNSKKIHIWAQYFNTSKNMWIDVDPTWGKTFGANYSGGNFSDRFALFFSTNGGDSKELQKLTMLDNGLKVNYSSDKLDYKPKVDINIISDQIVVGFPVNISVTVNNNSGVSIIGGNLEINSSNISLIGEKNQQVPVIFPFEKKVIAFHAKGNGLLKSTDGQISANFNAKSGLEKLELTSQKNIRINSIFSFGLQQILLILIIFLFIFGIFIVRFKIIRKTNS